MSVSVCGTLKRADGLGGVSGTRWTTGPSDTVPVAVNHGGEPNIGPGGPGGPDKSPRPPPNNVFRAAGRAARRAGHHQPCKPRPAHDVLTPVASSNTPWQLRISWNVQ
jgi:hypothetical protein